MAIVAVGRLGISTEKTEVRPCGAGPCESTLHVDLADVLATNVQGYACGRKLWVTATFSAARVALLFRENKHSIALSAGTVIQIAMVPRRDYVFDHSTIAKRRRH